MKPMQSDVLVIGGGPAGLSAAICLAEQGAQVVLCEARRYPHDKLCGEFLSPECAGLLAGLGMQAALAALRPVEIHTARITAPGGRDWQVNLPGVALGLSRRALDAALAERARQAGVQVYEQTTVHAVRGDLITGFTAQARSAAGECELSARLVIGAHGKRAALDRALQRQFLHKRQPYLALKAHFEGPAVPGRIELHGFPGGYCGLSEVEGGGLVACLLVHERVFQAAAGEAGQAIETFITWMQAQNEHLRDWFSQARRVYPRWISISQVCFDPKPAVEQDVLMAGDAAGLITPLAGNGIAMALQGGRLAADASAAFLAGELHPKDLRHQYPADWNQAFRVRLALGRILQPLMLRPQALGLALHLLRAFPRVGRFLVTYTRGMPN